MGSGGAIVMDEDNCMVDVAVPIWNSFAMNHVVMFSMPYWHKRILDILTKICDGKGTPQDLDNLQELAAVVKNNSLCALGQTVANPIVSTIKASQKNIKHIVVDHKCPAHVCKNMMEYYIIPRNVLAVVLVNVVAQLAVSIQPISQPNFQISLS